MGSSGETSRGETGPRASSPAEIDQKVARLKEARSSFERLSPADKAGLLATIRKSVYELAPKLARAACDAKGIAVDSELYGEEVLAGPVSILHYVRLLERSLRDIARHGLPQLPSDAIRERARGSSVRLVPLEAFDRVRFPGVEGEVWLDVAKSEAATARARFYRERPHTEVKLVLGAGNVAAIPALDALYALFVHGATCLLKLSPVNDYLGPLLERAFEPLVSRGFLAFVYGGPDVGAYATDHPDIDSIHVTGSSETYERIVWGTEPERSERKRRGEPRIAKRVTSELGNVTPVIVPPGDYGDKELDQLVSSLAGMVVHNASFNCIAAKMLVLPKPGRLREELLARLGRELEQVPLRRAYYPGAKERYDSLIASAPALKQIGRPGAEELPWTLITGLEPGQPAEQFRREPFCAILSEVAIDTSDPVEFLERATRFANQELWGSLAATVIQPSSLERDASLKAAFERAVEALEYGVVALNAWPGFVFGLSELPWGAWPGSTPADIRSGHGFAHNALMLEHVSKVVLRMPLAAFPTPVWSARRALRSLAQGLADYELDPGPIKLAKLGAAALKS